MKNEQIFKYSDNVIVFYDSSKFYVFCRGNDQITIMDANTYRFACLPDGIIIALYFSNLSGFPSPDELNYHKYGTLPKTPEDVPGPYYSVICEGCLKMFFVRDYIKAPFVCSDKCGKEFKEKYP